MLSDCKKKIPETHLPREKRNTPKEPAPVAAAFRTGSADSNDPGEVSEREWILLDKS
jgi:hypothetical protein